eukprot:Rhum_TRINITY_DN9583_c0_g1::Rhum_TRINITY_DN9583_c0_g1_i1::g.34170::m.34170
MQDDAGSYCGSTVVDVDNLEGENVQAVYDAIASEWHQTRRHPWALTRAWLQQRQPGELVGDVGCGNGRNLRGVADGVVAVGCDVCVPLLRFAPGERLRCCATQLPFRTASLDAVMSVAVVHHMSTPERRAQAFSELVRVVKAGGSVLIYVRSSECRALIHQGAQPIPCMPEEDITIEWRRTAGPPLARYHHLFPRHELEEEVRALADEARLVSFTQEKDNWVVVLEKGMGGGGGGGAEEEEAGGGNRG